MIQDNFILKRWASPVGVVSCLPLTKTMLDDRVAARSCFVIHVKYDNISTFSHKYVVRFSVELTLKNYKHG